MFFLYLQSLKKTTTEWQKEWQEAKFDLENRLRGQLKIIQEDKFSLKSQVEAEKQRLDNFVQSLLKVTQLPGLVKDLQNRLQTLEQEKE